jgi:HAD superfamily hydrolase (TIGR01457 family)
MTTRIGLGSLRGFIIDLDGTTYLGNQAIDGAREFLTDLPALGCRHLFVTNNSSSNGAAYVDKLRRLGLPARDEQVLTSGEATAMFLAREGYRRIFVVGTPSLEHEFEAVGLVPTADAADCVVLGFDKTLTYAKLETAGRLLLKGVPFIATHPDVVCPTEDGYIPDCGSMIALLKAATGVSPTVVGKPEPLLAQMALAKLDLRATDVAVIGDRLYTDMEMARRAGTIGILVLSGETSRETVEACEQPPDYVFDDLGALGRALHSLSHEHTDTVQGVR